MGYWVIKPNTKIDPDVEFAKAHDSTESLLQRVAPANIDIFMEYAFKDEKGKRIIQGTIHKEIQEHIDECKKRKLKNCGILAPWGHGKTEQVIGRTLDEMGKNKNIRIQIITNTDDNSTVRVTSIKKYIEEDKDYQAVYPDVQKGSNDDWGKHRLIIKRDSHAKDGTVEAWGITTSGTGSRADLQIFDDPVDMRNAILNPAMREQVKLAFTNVWLSRLVPDGFRIYIATVWHEDDLTHDLLKNEEWNFLIMRISEDFKSIECESCFKGTYSIPVWEIWNTDRLKEQLRTIGSRAFERGYRQKALSDEDRTFPHSEVIFNWDLYPGDIVLPHWARVTGVDPFGQAVVIFTLAVAPDGRRVPISIKRGKWAPKRTVRELLQDFDDFNSQIIVVENNASQDAIIQWAQEVGRKDMPIIPFCTGKQKADPELGLPSMDVEFENGAWVVCMKGIEETDAENTFNIWRRELRSHPIAEAADTVMASWFAREGARFLLKPKDETPDEVYGEDLGVEEVQIGSYD